MDYNSKGKKYNHGLIYDVNGEKIFTSRQRAVDYIVINKIKDAKVRRRVVNEPYEGEPENLVLHTKEKYYDKRNR